MNVAHFFSPTHLFEVHQIRSTHLTLFVAYEIVYVLMRGRLFLFTYSSFYISPRSDFHFNTRFHSDCLGVTVTDSIITTRCYCRRYRRQHWSCRRWCSWWLMHFFIVISKWRIITLSLWHSIAGNLQAKEIRFFVIHSILLCFFYQLLLLCQPVNASDRSMKVKKGASTTR